VAAAGERYLVLLHITGHGPGSGVSIDLRIGQVWTLRDGLVWRADAYPTQEEARAAAGLAT
jgi:hypothetical protein